jgi:hemerythrin-like domain-containing protein
MCDHCGCRAFAPIADLTEDHELILAKAWSLAETARSGRLAPVRDIDILLTLLDVHVAKEETGLYPELLAVDGLTESACTELETEHRELRAALAGGAFDRPGYYALAAHIEIEEMELFSSAMLRFDERDWDDMDAAHHTAEQRAGPTLP